MTNQNDVGSPDAESPKKKGLDLSSFLKHVAEVDTSIGKVYLFPLRTSDLQAFNALSSSDSAERTREFLPCIASLSPDYGLKHERVGITSVQAASLSEKEIEVIAEAFASSNGVRSAREGGKDRTPIVRAADEPATAHLGRLMHSEIKDQANQYKKLREQALGSTHAIFDQVRKASQALGDTRLQFERLTKSSAIRAVLSPPIDAKSVESNNHIAEYSARLARERSEDREMVRLTGQMTAQSAETLQELAAAASTMLAKLDQRDEEARRTTKVQLWIAVGSVIVSAILALFALVVSIAAFYQDNENISSGDKWQVSVLEELKTANEKSSQTEMNHVAALRLVEQLRARVLELESRLTSKSGPPKKAQQE